MYKCVSPGVASAGIAAARAARDSGCQAPKAQGQWSSRTMSSLELRLLLVALALAARLDACAMHVELDEGLGREGRKVGALDNCAGRAGEV